MDIWKVLGIEPTKDKDTLKKVYRVKLTAVNPEDDPEGFMELRKAYEEAVRLADIQAGDEAEEKEESPLHKALREVYDDYSSRINADSWNELFDRDEFVALDTAEDSFNEMLVFLMDNFHLPQKIWKIIVEQFDINERRKELAEKYPEDFIDYILSNAEFEDILNYYMLDGDESCFDAYIEQYYQLDNAIRRHDVEAQTKLIESLEAMDVYHPYLEICKARNEIQSMPVAEAGNGEAEEKLAVKYDTELDGIQKRMEELLEEHPEDIFIINSCGDTAMVHEKYELAKKYYDMSFELEPENYMVKGKQAELKYCLGEYEQSRDMYMELLKINHYDNSVRAGMMRANQALIEELKKKLYADPKDNKSRMEMAWSYYQSYKFDEAIAVLDEFEPDRECACEYNNVKGRTYLCLCDYDKALACFERWRDEIDRIPKEDTSKDSIDKKKRYEYVNFLISNCYLKTGRFDKAREYLNIALAKEHDEIILSYEARCELEYETENYSECIRACEELLERDSRSFIGYNYMSKASAKMEYYKEAMNACEHAIRIYPYVSDPYALEARIYLDVNQIDGARHTIERYRVFGIDSDSIDYWEARILESEGKHNEVVELLDKTLNRGNPDETDMDDYHELYMLLGFNLEKIGENERAMKLYKHTVEIVPEHKAAYGRMGILLKNMGRYNEAINMLTKQLDINPHPFYYTHRGILNQYLQNYKSAIADYEEAIRLEFDNSFCLTRIGSIYELHREFDRALEYYDKALQYMDAEEDRQSRAMVYSLQARTLQCMNKFDESRRRYEEYFEEFGLNADVAYDYAALLQRMDRVDDAAAILKRCIETLEYDEDVQACIRQLCSVYGEEGYIDMANESFMLAISKKPDDARAYAIMAEIFKNHGLMDNAKDLYEKAVMYDTGNKQNYYSALIEVILSRKTLFTPDLSEYVKKALIDGNDMHTPIEYIKNARLKRVTAGSSKHGLMSLISPGKMYKEAMAIIDRGLKIKRCSGCFYCRCHEALYEKGLIYEAMKDYEMAKMCYKEALEICGHNALYEERLKKLEKKDRK